MQQMPAPSTSKKPSGSFAESCSINIKCHYQHVTQHRHFAIGMHTYGNGCRFAHIRGEMVATAPVKANGDVNTLSSDLGSPDVGKGTLCCGNRAH